MYPQSFPEPPIVVWRRFAIWAMLSLIGLLALGGFSRYSGVLVLAWAIGMVIAATLMLVRRI